MPSAASPTGGRRAETPMADAGLPRPDARQSPKHRPAPSNPRTACKVPSVRLRQKRCESASVADPSRRRVSSPLRTGSGFGILGCAADFSVEVLATRASGIAFDLRGQDRVVRMTSPRRHLRLRRNRLQQCKLERRFGLGGRECRHQQTGAQEYGDHNLHGKFLSRLAISTLPGMAVAASPIWRTLNENPGGGRGLCRARRRRHGGGAKRRERVLWNDPATGVMRHPDAGYEIAVGCARVGRQFW
jgi:hypothetical protein